MNHYALFISLFLHPFACLCHNRQEDHTQKEKGTMAVLIQNGTIVTAVDTTPADILIDEGKIQLIGTHLTADDAEVVDATGHLLLPGGIDVHTHLDLPVAGTISADDFYSGHKGALFGGTTSHIDFATQRKGESALAALEKWHQLGQGTAVMDYGVHMVITDFRDDILAELPLLAQAGVTSLKLFLAYKGVYQLEDAALFRLMERAAECGMMVLVHAENGDVIDTLSRRAQAEGRRDTPSHLACHPAWAEAEATLRAIALAGLAGVPLYVVHMTCQESVEQIQYGRAKGLPVMGETCPQYLFFTGDELSRPDGAKWVCSPPLRTERDQAFLWQALARGDLQVVGTDHCPFLYDGVTGTLFEGERFTRPGKELGRGNFAQIPNGLNGIEERLLLLWHFGVGQKRFSANRFVAITATNPAQIFGLYPRKGTIAVGSDADVVLWNPQKRTVLGTTSHHIRLDHNVYEGMEVMGGPAKVWSNGRLMVDGETWLGQRGDGHFLRRGGPTVL